MILAGCLPKRCRLHVSQWANEAWVEKAEVPDRHSRSVGPSGLPFRGPDFELSILSFMEDDAPGYDANASSSSGRLTVKLGGSR